MTCNGLHRALAVLVLCAASVAAQAGPRDSYSLTLIGTAQPNDPVGWFDVTDINNRNELVGARSAADGSALAFRWRNGEFHELNPMLPATSAFASAINNSSVVFGSYEDPQFATQDFLLRGDRATLIEPLVDDRNVSALDLNDRGQALLQTINDEAGFRYYRWQRGRYSRLEPLPGSLSTSFNRMNEFGAVVGYASFEDHSVPVLWWGGTLMELDRPAGWQFVVGVDLNNRGRVLVNANFPAAPARTGSLVWALGEYSVLPPIPGNRSTNATDINNHNVVVGRSSDLLATEMTATLWQRGRAIDLNTRVRSSDPLAPFVHLEWGLLINDHGLIVARGVDSRDTDGRFGFYLLKPR